MAVALAVISSMLICRSVTADATDAAVQNKSAQLRILDMSIQTVEKHLPFRIVVLISGWLEAKVRPGS